MEPALAGRDVLGLAPTGTGKTAAFLVPVAHRLLDSPPPKQPRRLIDPNTRLRALVLCPTRELAIQVSEEAARICADSVLRIGCVYGKVGLKPQAEVIAAGIDLLVGTPGRVRELLGAGATSLASIRHLMIDEADRMLDLGFLPQVRAIFETVPEGRQTLFFTATMPREVCALTEQFLRDPAVIEIEGHTAPARHVSQHLVPIADRDKVPLLLHLIRERLGKGVLVFCRTRRRVGWVGAALQRHGVACGMIHGDRTQTQRLKALARFSNNDLDVLVSTDVAARGLHVPAVYAVINYDLPNDPEEYVHRIGRAGHGGGRGESYTFLDAERQAQWDRIRRAVGVSLPAESVPGFEPPPRATSRHPTKRFEPEKPTRKAGAQQSKSGRKQSRTDGERPRSKKSRPIRKGEKPGRGAQKPDDRRN